MNAGAALAPGATLLCKARAAPHAPALESLSLQALPAASGLAAMTGSSPVGATGSWTNCTVEIPFYWTGAEAGSLALLSYEIDAVSGPGARAVPLRVAEGIAVPYPSPGGTARLSFNVTF
jgi:hypothetical protein